MLSTEPTRPTVSVVVCTRNRGGAVIETIESLLANEGPSFDLIVVDQSDDHVTQTSVEPYVERGDINYIHSSTRGVAAARNLGIRRARAGLVAFTDDDCQAGKHWLRDIVAAFSRDSRIGIVHGNVLAAPHDSSQGFIPAYRCDKPFMAKTLRDKSRVDGIGACMGLRKQTWNALSGFDEVLGTGAPFHSAEELDFDLRALLAGVWILETPELHVVHYGFRSWKDGSGLLRGHLYGIGAVFAKLLKCGHWPVTLYLAHLAGRWMFGRPAVDFGRRPSRTLRLFAFLKGFWAGLRWPVDRDRQHFE